MSKRRRAKRPEAQDFDGPQKPGEGQVLAIERFNEGSVGTKRRYRNVGEHPLTLAHFRGQISDDQHDAGEHYRELFETRHRSGRDSTQCLDRSMSGAAPTPWSDRQAEASRMLQAIDRAMPKRSRAIVRAFCGEGRSPASAVRGAVLLHRPQGVMDRLREALTDLVDAINAARSRNAA